MSDTTRVVINEAEQAISVDSDGVDGRAVRTATGCVVQVDWPGRGRATMTVEDERLTWADMCDLAQAAPSLIAMAKMMRPPRP